MKIAALGDIHSNYIALKACLDWISENDVDEIAFLGDYVSDCPYPERTMRLIYEAQERYPCYFVRGNREDYMLSHRFKLTEEWAFGTHTGSLLYTFENLTGTDLRFFDDMPIGMEVKHDGYPVFSICHGSMQDNRCLFRGDTPETYAVMDEMTTKLLVCGHSHIPFVCKKGEKTIFNPGTVGIPCNGQTAAQFALITSDGGDWTAKQITVPYDNERVIRQFSEGGLLEKGGVWSRTIIAMLKTGRHYNAECIELVKRLCEERELDFDDEAVWLKAAEILEI